MSGDGLFYVGLAVFTLLAGVLVGGALWIEREIAKGGRVLTSDGRVVDLRPFAAGEYVCITAGKSKGERGVVVRRGRDSVTGVPLYLVRTVSHERFVRADWLELATAPSAEVRT